MIIRQKFDLIAILLAVALMVPVAAQNQWEGTAVVGRYGEFPPGGLYAASNTFPLNSMVSVTNTRNGKSARLIVVKTVDDPGIFLLLSESAAYELGVTSGSTVGVRVSPVQLPGLTSIDPNQDLPFHPDPDVNPAASLGDPNASIIRPTSPLVPPVAAVPEDSDSDSDSDSESPESPEVDEGDVASNGVVTGVAPTIAGRLAEESGEPEASLPRVNPVSSAEVAVALALPAEPAVVNGDTEETEAEQPVAGDPLEERMAEVERTLSEERVSMAPLGVPAPPAATAPDTTVVEATIDPPEPPNNVRVVVELPPADPDDDAEIPLPPYRPQELAPGEIALPLVPLSPEGDGEPLRPTRIPEDALVRLEPAEARSPEPDPVPEAEAEAEAETDTDTETEAVAEEEREEPVQEEPADAAAIAATPEPAAEPESAPQDDDVTWARENLPLVASLSSGSSYVQVAAFSNPRSARTTIDELGERFPVAVVPQDAQDEETSSVYRIFVGPLSEDEKGSALYTVRRRGFRDAFVRDQP
jgi:hypothetical protein